MVKLTTTEQVIEALGGKAAVGAMTGRTANAVWNWKDRQSFPTNTFAILKAALHAKGADAPDALWNMAEGAQ